MSPSRPGPDLWRAAGLAAALLCVAAPLLLPPSHSTCRRGTLLTATKSAARRQLQRLPEVQVAASAAALAQRARDATAKVAAGLPAGFADGGGGVPAPYRRVWRQLDVDCGGGWKEQYAQLHGNITGGRAPERLVVSVATATGLADRLLGTISAFYYALLSGRALQLQTYGEVPSLELALAPNRIDWRRAPDPEALTDVAWKQVPFGPTVDTKRYAYVRQGLWPPHVNDEAAPDEMFLRGNMSLLPAQNPEAPVVLFASNRGRTVHMFENPHHGRQLREWGLTPETAFTCAFMYLFKPQPPVAQRLQPEAARTLTAAPGALKIGIHMRLGDAEMEGSALSIADVEQRTSAVWDCVQQIEDTRRQPDQQVFWFLVSDSLTARRAAKARHGNKLITDTEVAAVHVGCETDAGCRGNASRKAAAMQAAIGDILALALTDVQCVPVNSGFGKIAAFLARPRKAIYTMPGLNWAGYGTRSCGPTESDSVYRLADNWSGF